MKRIFILTSLFFYTHVASIYAQAMPEYAEPIPMPAHITWQNSAGESVSIADYKGKVLFLNLWATHCAPCVYEMKMFDFLQKRYAGAGFEVVAVTGDDSLEKIKEFYKKQNIRFMGMYTDSDKNVQQALEVKALPTTYLINREGNIIAAHSGLTDWLGDEMRAQIQNALRESYTKEAEHDAEIVESELTHGIHR